MKYDYAVFIGRFQPYHSGHHYVALEALKKAHNLIFILGSHDSPRTPKNPFNSSERISVIRSCFNNDTRIKFGTQTDHLYNEDRWIASVQSSVYSLIFNDGFKTDKFKICLIGYSKDHSSYYLKKFPQWDTIEIKPKNDWDATKIREQLFINNKMYDNSWIVNDKHEVFVKNYSENINSLIKNEWNVIHDYKKSWESSPYPPTFQTVDAIVTQSGHVLLVRRRAAPGKGLWALPGGFVNNKETLREATLRELKEETGIKVPDPVLIGSINKVHTYDAPDRSLRGRTITQATWFKLNDMESLPKIKGSDDADKAKWVPYGDFVQMRKQLFEDHYNIIEHMLNI